MVTTWPVSMRMREEVKGKRGLGERQGVGDGAGGGEGALAALAAKWCKDVRKVLECLVLVSLVWWEP